jgi:hypothetical protein
LLLNDIAGDEGEQMGEVPKKLATGIGFTVTVIVVGVPEQPFAIGVIV